MKFHEQRIAGVFLIEAQPFVDARGEFRRNFCEREFEASGLASVVKQANVSINPHRHTLRGFHYQIAPFGEGKTLNCFSGALYDIVVDLRPDSPTYKQWIGVELNAANRQAVHVPPGCAHAFLTLEPHTTAFYYCSHAYMQQAERGIRFDDPAFDFRWPASPAMISDKDRAFPDYTDAEAYRTTPR